MNIKRKRYFSGYEYQGYSRCWNTKNLMYTNRYSYSFSGKYHSPGDRRYRFRSIDDHSYSWSGKKNSFGFSGANVWNWKSLCWSKGFC